MVYDVTSAESFVNVKRWLHEINQNCDDVCRILGKAAGRWVGRPGAGLAGGRGRQAQTLGTLSPQTVSLVNYGGP